MRLSHVALPWLVLLGSTGAHATDIASACANRLLPEGGAGEVASLSAKTLVELRDIGYPAAIPGAVQLTASPDGSAIAFPIQRADTASDRYCSGLVIFDLARRRARIIGASQALAMQDLSYRGPIVARAAQAFVVARWSPDGRWLAFEREQDAVTSLWKIRPDGTGLTAIPGTGDGIDDFVWSGDGRRLIVAVHGAKQEQLEAIRHEAATGFHFDDRFLPFIAQHPLVMTGDPQIISIDADEGTARPTVPVERDRLHSVHDVSRKPAPANHERIAWIAPEHADRFGSPNRLQVTDRSVSETCGDVCRNVTDFWWAADGRTLLFLRKEGWANEDTALFAWRSDGAGAPRRLMATRGSPIGAAILDAQLLCARETSSKPRHIVAIDLKDGRVTPLFDPNPDYPGNPSSPITRLHWRTDRGSAVFGDLVLPVGYHPGTHYPLVVTTYQSRGFLRGGTGDEYPVQLFASHGLMVLSLERPTDLGSDMPTIRSASDLERYETSGWADRANVHSAVMNGIGLLVARGMVDPAQVGISGLSDGSETVVYGLIHHPAFAAASISNCCNDAGSFLALGGPVTARYFRAIGYPPLTDQDETFWSPISLAYHGSTLRTPLLMQLPDSESLLSLNALEALREGSAPVDAYVFADEGHVKTGPIHRLAIYNRNVAWFDYWLRDQKDPELVPADELSRWDTLKRSRKPAAEPPSPVQCAIQASTSAR